MTAAPWFTAADLAGQAGLPGTARGVIKMAQREGWKTRKRTKGKGVEYALESLPAETRKHLLRRSVATVVATQASEPAKATRAPRAVSELAGWQREVMQARLSVCAMVDAAVADHEISPRQAIDLVLAEASGEAVALLRLANARGRNARLPSRASVYRWMGQRHDGAAALAPQPARGPEPNPAWLAPLLALYQVPQKPAVSDCLDALAERQPDLRLPALRTAQRHIRTLPAEVRNYGRMGRNALRAVQPFVRRTMDGLWPMDVVTVDGHLFKAYTAHPMAGGQKIRPEVTTYLDIATRKAIGFSAWLAESHMAIWAALRDMVLHTEQGIPALHYSDNGAYRGEAHRAVLARIGTTMMFSQAYRAQARGVIERFNSSVWLPLAKRFETYVNDDADAEAVKKALAIANRSGANLIAWLDFLELCRQAIHDYNNTPHSALGRNVTPNQAWAQAVADGWRPTTLDHDDLHDLLPNTVRTVNRGWVRIPWGHYFDEQLSAYHGRRVVVGVHPTDGSRVWVSEDTGRLICVAQRDGNAKPYVSESMLGHARAQRAAGRMARLERKMDAVRAESAELLDVPPAELGGEVVRLPRRPAAELPEDVDAEQAQYDEWLKSALAPAMRNLRENSLWSAPETGDEWTEKTG